MLLLLGARRHLECVLTRPHLCGRCPFDPCISYPKSKTGGNEESRNQDWWIHVNSTTFIQSPSNLTKDFWFVTQTDWVEAVFNAPRPYLPAKLVKNGDRKHTIFQKKCQLYISNFFQWFCTKKYFLQPKAPYCPILRAAWLTAFCNLCTGCCAVPARIWLEPMA